MRIASLVRTYPRHEPHLADLPYRLSSPSAVSPDDARVWTVEDGRVVAYAVVQSAWGPVDYLIEPGLEDVIGPELAAWLLPRLQEISASELDWCIDSRAELAVRNKFAESLGFRRSDSHLVEHECSLASLPDRVAPPGFVIRELAGAAETAAVAQLQRTAFASANMTTQCRQRTLNAPGYRSELDLVAVAPDETLAAFCLSWLDPAGCYGQIEPTGTHPDYVRHGLGRALLAETFHRLAEYGASSVRVEAVSVDPAALAFYAASGFRAIGRIEKYARRFQP